MGREQTMATIRAFADLDGHDVCEAIAMMALEQFGPTSVGNLTEMAEPIVAANRTVRSWFTTLEQLDMHRKLNAAMVAAGAVEIELPPCT